MQRSARLASSSSVRLTAAPGSNGSRIDWVADHSLRLPNTAWVAEQDLHGGRDRAPVLPILLAIRAHADQGVAEERDPFARVPGVVDVAARCNQVPPSSHEYIVTIEDPGKHGGLYGDDGPLGVIEA